MQRSVLWFRPHRIQRYINNRTNWMSNYFITINSCCRCAFQTERHSSRATRPPFLATINLCTWKSVCHKFKTTFGSPHRSSTRSMPKRWDTGFLDAFHSNWADSFEQSMTPYPFFDFAFNEFIFLFDCNCDAVCAVWRVSKHWAHSVFALGKIYSR